MTRFQMLQHCDHLEGRNAAIIASMKAYMQRRFTPQFIMLPNPDIWANEMPHPQDDEQPSEWGRVMAGCAGAAVAIVLVAAANAFIRPW